MTSLSRPCTCPCPHPRSHPPRSADKLRAELVYLQALHVVRKYMVGILGCVDAADGFTPRTLKTGCLRAASTTG
eukprot:765096-Hanusia_phi.AAC.8